MSGRVPAVEAEHAYRACERITHTEAANFYYGIRLLPRNKREAMSAVYAFARRVDDIGDGALDADTQLARLAAQRAALAELSGASAPASDPVTVALAHAHDRFDLPLGALELLIDGVELDVLGTRYDTFEDLVGYCRRVAGSIGRLCVAIFTDGTSTSQQTAALADDLGVAMQLTNILRDILEDAERGRRYLPAEDIRHFGCTTLPAVPEERAARLIAFEAERAGAWFERSLALVDALDRRSAACVLAMSGIYRAILRRIVVDPVAVLRGRISLPAWQKARVAAYSVTATRNGRSKSW
jgi:15-cis-phytoene synthase